MVLADHTYRIGEVAARSGLTPDTLRFFERLGLLPKPSRTRGGFRLYAAAAFDRLQFIKRAQMLGSLRRCERALESQDATACPVIELRPKQ